MNSLHWTDKPETSLLLSRLTKAAALLVVVGLSLLIGWQICDVEHNGLALALRWATGLAFVVSVISPTTGVYLVLLICPVLDLIKRCLVLYSTIDQSDIASVLALTPVAMYGAFFGTLAGRAISGRALFRRGEFPLFVFVGLLDLLVIVGALKSHEDSKLRVLQMIAETTAYVSLAFLVSARFQTEEAVARFFRVCMVLFVPVAFYGVWQHIYGFNQLEVRYMLSGFSLTEGELFAYHPRPYSTLNSPHSFSIVMACCALFALLQRRLPAIPPWERFLRNRAWFFFLVFCAGSFISYRRTGWIVAGVALLAFFCFRSPGRTIAFYATAFGSLLLIIFNTHWLYLQLPIWENELRHLSGNSDSYAFQLQTFNDRLWSFENLLNNPRVWTLFGGRSKEEVGGYIHDAISEALISYGVFGLLAILLVMFLILRVVHRMIWRVRDPSRRRYSALLLGVVFSNVFVGALFQTHITIFPINFLFWFCVGALLKATLVDREEGAAIPAIAVAAVAGAPGQGTDNPADQEATGQLAGVGPAAAARRRQRELALAATPVQRFSA